MEIVPAVPEWTTWIAAGAIGALALAALARMLEAALDLEVSQAADCRACVAGASPVSSSTPAPQE